MWVLHRCDNPPCVNPDHLFLGDHTTNMRDMVAKGRHMSKTKPHLYVRGDMHHARLKPHLVVRGERHGCAKLTAAQAAAIYGDQRLARIVAAEYGVSDTTIYDIRKGKRWNTN
jgi:hypothetical protein